MLETDLKIIREKLVSTGFADTLLNAYIQEYCPYKLLKTPAECRADDSCADCWKRNLGINKDGQ